MINYLIVRGENELKDYHKSDQGWSRVKTKGRVQHLFVDEKSKHSKAEKRVHLKTQ